VAAERDNGCYFTPVGKKTAASKHGRDDGMVRELWEWTERTLGECGFRIGEV
jgi:hypothetical protein